ncbi:hypothetical protein ABZ726_10615 [Streptomyces hundungensis]|uniref:hypothetical protein n=1 Tax=Streptomyces hundungensis TaxID=1077946 RepID=UPI0033C47500
MSVAKQIEDLDEQMVIVAGRRAPFTMVGDWITVHDDLDPQAKALYPVIAAHVNVGRGDNLAWPTRQSMAEILNWSREQSVDKYIDQLVAVGAIETEEAVRANGAKGKLYLVHTAPPPDYTGPTTLAEWYARRREALKATTQPKKPRPAKAATKAASTTAAAEPAPPAQKTAAAKKKATAARKTKERSPEEQQRFERADKGARLWWEEKAPALVQAKKMARLSGTPKQKSSKFIAVRGLIEGALSAGYDSRQILTALEDVARWLPSAQAFDDALARTDGVAPRRGPQPNTPLYRDSQWTQGPPAEEQPTPKLAPADEFAVLDHADR